MQDTPKFDSRQAEHRKLAALAHAENINSAFMQSVLASREN